MKDTIDFLRRLQANNNRTWFNEHKDEFLSVQSKFHQFTRELIGAIAQFDPRIHGLGSADCTYRIYRDVRFSEDKRPYKHHLGAFICPGGKKSGYSGYYFHVSTGGADNYPDAHMLAVGDYCFTPQVLKILREDICNGEGDFEQTLKMANPVFKLDMNDALKRNPKGFPSDAPYSEYLRLKSYCLCYTPNDDFICKDNLVERVASLFQTTKPFLDYLNRAIEYAHTEP